MLPLRRSLAAILAVFALILFTPPGPSAQEASWRVSKVSGQAWLEPVQATPVAVTNEMTVPPGQTIRTGQSGRLLLTRGGQSILVSPNTSLTLPAASDGPQSRVQQQIGSILLEVDKREADHFEVQTPFLAAVVKGTQFRVTVSATGADVEVIEGRVHVLDYRSGDSATVGRDQSAGVALADRPGLRLGGNRPLPLIEPGLRRQSPFPALPVGPHGLQPVVASADQPAQDGRNALGPHASSPAANDTQGTPPGKRAGDDNKRNAGAKPADTGEAASGAAAGTPIRWRNPPEPSWYQKVFAALSSPVAGLVIGGSFVIGIAASFALSRRKTPGDPNGRTPAERGAPRRGTRDDGASDT